MKRSKLIAGIGALGLVTTLAACSGQTESGGDAEALTVWTFKQSQVAALEAAGEAWTEESGRPVEVSVYTPDDAYLTKVQAAAKSKTLPDIISVHSQGEEWKLAQAGIIQDLTDDFDADWQSDFLPGVVEATQLTDEAIKNSGTDPATTLQDLEPGNLYAVPYLAGTPGVVFSNKKLLAAAGVDPETPPSTWEEWIAAIEKTKAHDSESGSVVTGLQVPQTGYFWLYRPLAYAYLGADDFTSRQGETQDPAWTSAKSVETLDLYDQLTPLWAPGVLGLGIDQADQAFASGAAAWDVGGTFTLSSLSTFGLDTEDVSVFAVPPSEKGELDTISYQASPLVSGAISSTTTKKEDALSFLKFLTSDEGATIFAQEANDLPATAIPVESLTSPLLQQLVGLVTPVDGVEPFNPNDFSADPGGDVANATAVELAKLPAKSATTEQVAASLAEIYANAWKVLE
ncbi:extracellular solute-binding protein [Microbacterium sp. SSW1-49]|uniref:Extracellular solute-binding protein n=1 Tax=Microbacterium croceum TaxID=2851645 RepID=A0ABT0FB43_9MICO|nr:extracellular solute-binding protein [Microbacterium croceum]MCK2034937.1 extracellular solute-binding protein [Microbacterium croceum]